MKIIVYNIAYGTGLKGSLREYFLKFWRYLWAHNKALQKIIKLLKKQNADVICLLETDTGSLRNRFQCQVKTIAKKLFLPFYKSTSKYHPNVWFKSLPLFSKQHDAVLSKKKGKLIAHYFSSGMKNLVQEFVVNNTSIFVVHLSVLRENVRKIQLKELGKIINKCPRRHLICGDFNIFGGLKEVRDFIRENKLKLIQKKATFPSFKPKRPLDLIMACKSIKVKSAGVIKALCSDHLPVYVEID